MSRVKFEDSAISRYDDILNHFINLALNRFQWNNLPLGLTSEKFEQLIMSKGQLMGFKDKKGGLYILPCSGVQDLNVYGLPQEYEIFSVNGERFDKVDIEDGVLFKNNPIGSEDLSALEIFAKRIDDTEMTQDVNLYQQNMPKLLLADDGNKITSKALMQKINDFKFVVFAKKTLGRSIEKSDVLDTSSPFILDKLNQHGIELYNGALTRLGINNNNNMKKERMIVDEVNSNNDLISINLDLMFDMREKACKEFNEKFDWNLEVKKREVEQVESVHIDDKTTSGE